MMSVKYEDIQIGDEIKIGSEPRRWYSVTMLRGIEVNGNMVVQPDEIIDHRRRRPLRVGDVVVSLDSGEHKKIIAVDDDMFWGKSMSNQSWGTWPLYQFVLYEGET